MPLLHTFVLAVAEQFIAFDNDPFVSSPPENFVWINGEGACPILVDSNEDKGVLRLIC